MTPEDGRPITRVGAEQIPLIVAGELRDPTQRLRGAKGQPCGVPASEVVVSDDLAADGGCDGWSPAHGGMLT